MASFGSVIVGFHEWDKRTNEHVSAPSALLELWPKSGQPWWRCVSNNDGLGTVDERNWMHCQAPDVDLCVICVVNRLKRLIFASFSSFHPYRLCRPRGPGRRVCDGVPTAALRRRRVCNVNDIVGSWYSCEFWTKREIFMVNNDCLREHAYGSVVGIGWYRVRSRNILRKELTEGIVHCFRMFSKWFKNKSIMNLYEIENKL